MVSQNLHRQSLSSTHLLCGTPVAIDCNQLKAHNQSSLMNCRDLTDLLTQRLPQHNRDHTSVEWMRLKHFKVFNEISTSGKYRNRSTSAPKAIKPSLFAVQFPAHACKGRINYHVFFEIIEISFLKLCLSIPQQVCQKLCPQKFCFFFLFWKQTWIILLSH